MLCAIFAFRNSFSKPDVDIVDNMLNRDLPSFKTYVAVTATKFIAEYIVILLSSSSNK